MNYEGSFLISGVCKGFIRVIMNLSRPINVLPGTSCPSVLNLTQESSTSEKQKTLTSFYLPHETEKTLCINSLGTTRDVIRSLLLKFRIVDNPHKYVLYEKKPFSNGRRRSSETSEKSTVTISGMFFGGFITNSSDSFTNFATTNLRFFFTKF